MVYHRLSVLYECEVQEKDGGAAINLKTMVLKSMGLNKVAKVLNVGGKKGLNTDFEVVSS